ncbi:MAG: sulfatase-like hydrolase/transferase [Oscillospiraceae bacterium]|nr:sulfatase-like hydrolase/transferase [Oscillospiraceae bacterium]
MESNLFTGGRRRLPLRFLTWLCFFFGSLVYWELLLHLCVFPEISLKFFYAVGFSLTLALLFTLILSFIPKKVSYWIAFSLSVLLAILYASQLVYFFVFGSLYSVGLMGEGGNAITSFWRETLNTILTHLPQLLLLFVPTAGLLIFRKFFRSKMKPLNYVWWLLLAFLVAFTSLINAACLKIEGTGFFSPYYFYYNESTTTDQAAESFGLLTAMRLELTGGEEQAAAEEEEGGYYTPDQTPDDVQDTTEETQEEAPKYNVLELDFSALNSKTNKKAIKELNNYFAGLTGTQQNEYTGMLADYNLIYICAESFSTAAIYPELMPTLYKLSTEGFIFNNYYNTYPNVTTDGEYTMCMGIFPDITRKKSDASFRVSQDNYLPFTLGNLFSSQRNIQSYGYHNYKGSYYGRNKTHPNMGYEMKFMNAGMKFTSSWPASDLEMMEQSIGDYIGQEQFHAYYMTFSGHYQYNTEGNVIARRNWDTVKDLPYSETARAYLACHMELEKALTYLMEQLEAAGVAEKTAIVIAGDHFPYGLKNSQYSELIGYDIDYFTKQKSSLIFWVGGLEKPIEVDTYCCNVDILPTVLNLWGFQYDSRLLTGTDVFSDGTHVAILRDNSFYTDKVWFNASKNKIKYLVDESEVPEDYVENMVKLIKTKFEISKDILDLDYYRFVFDNSDVGFTSTDIVNVYKPPKKKVETETPVQTPQEQPPVQTPQEQPPVETPQEQTPVETPQEQTPVETPQEQTPVETPQEQTPAA